MEIDKQNKPGYMDEERKKDYEKKIEQNEEIRKTSGEVVIAGENSQIVALFYILLRDKFPAGELENLVSSVEKDIEYKFSNGWLARYAEFLVKKIIK